MSLILSIDSSGPVAYIVLQEGENILGVRSHTVKQNHASFVQVAIQEILTNTKKDIHELAAIATVSGPGSYTGLRVGMASAKGICYALQIPLLLLDTLPLIAFANLQTTEYNCFSGLICPMIDARRMEVFTAIYDRDMQEKLSPRPFILDNLVFDSWLEKTKILFCGSGMAKFQAICTHPHAVFSSTGYDERAIAHFSFQFFREKRFASLAYCEPYYVKEFYTPPKQ